MVKSVDSREGGHRTYSSGNASRFPSGTHRCSSHREVAEGARFEAPATPEIIDHEVTESSDSPALTDETEAGRGPIITHWKG